MSGTMSKEAMDGLRRARAVRLKNGTTWSLPDESTGDENTVGWKLRYAPNQITRDDQLYLASLLECYWQLVRGPTPRENLTMLRAAVRDPGRTAGGGGEP